MGRRGPAPKPTALKLAAGNPGKRRLNHAEPVPPAGMPDPPFPLSAEGQAVWDALVPRLAASGLARSIDGHALYRYCELAVLWHKILSEVQKLPGFLSMPDAQGRTTRVIKLPGRSELKQLSSSLLLLEREFGLTPASRSRITLELDRVAKGDNEQLKAKFLPKDKVAEFYRLGLKVIRPSTDGQKVV